MGLNTFRNQEERRPASTYWRRRFFALVGGLAIFAVLAWSVSGAIGGVKTISPAANVVTGNQHRHAGGGPQPEGRGAVQAPRPSPSPSAPARHRHTTGRHTARPHPGRSARPAPRKTPTRPKPPARPTGSASPAPGGHGGPPGRPRSCAAGSVVISLFAGQVSYPARGRPAFDVDVVSTGVRTCTFNVGAKYLALTIKAGSVRVWNSADCPQGRKSLFTDLVKGVPTVLSISWDRRTSSPGCRLASSTVPAGLYTATASSGKVSSNKEIFRIR